MDGRHTIAASLLATDDGTDHVALTRARILRPGGPEKHVDAVPAHGPEFLHDGRERRARGPVNPARDAARCETPAAFAMSTMTDGRHPALGPTGYSSQSAWHDCER